MSKVLRIILFLLMLLLGGFLFVYGEIDDSPGGQMLGLVMVVVGVWYLVRGIRNK